MVSSGDGGSGEAGSEADRKGAGRQGRPGDSSRDRGHGHLRERRGVRPGGKRAGGNGGADHMGWLALFGSAILAFILLALALAMISAILIRRKRR